MNWLSSIPVASTESSHGSRAASQAQQRDDKKTVLDDTLNACAETPSKRYPYPVSDTENSGDNFPTMNTTSSSSRAVQQKSRSSSPSDAQSSDDGPLYRLGTTLDQLGDLFLRISSETPSEDVSDFDINEATGASYPRNRWRQSISSCQTDGSDGSNGSGKTSSSHGDGLNSGESVSSWSFLNKRGFGSGSQSDEDNPEDSRKKNPRKTEGPDTFGSNAVNEGHTQIPCFVDNCQGKDAHISELM